MHRILNPRIPNPRIFHPRLFHPMVQVLQSKDLSSWDSRMISLWTNKNFAVMTTMIDDGVDDDGEEVDLHLKQAWPKSHSGPQHLFTFGRFYGDHHYHHYHY